MSLKSRLQDEMKAAMKNRDKPRLGVIRLMLAEIKQKEIDQRVSLDDDSVVALLDRMLKQRRESASQYRDAGREDLVSVEEFEGSVIQEFLPAPLTADEINALIGQAIDQVGAASVRDMGKVMAGLKPLMQGRADMAEISKLVKGRLAGS